MTMLCLTGHNARTSELNQLKAKCSKEVKTVSCLLVIPHKGCIPDSQNRQQIDESGSLAQRPFVVPSMSTHLAQSPSTPALVIIYDGKGS